MTPLEYVFCAMLFAYHLWNIWRLTREIKADKARRLAYQQESEQWEAAIAEKEHQLGLRP